MFVVTQEGGFVHGTRPECRLGSGHTRSPNSLWSLSSAAATEVKLAFRSQLRELVLFNLEPVAQREDHWTALQCRISRSSPPPDKHQPDVSLLLPTMTVQQQKSAPRPYVRHQLLSHGIYIERHAAACSRLLSVLLPFPPRGRSPD